MQNTIISLIPKTILTLNQSSDNFKVQYISFSTSMFQEAVFRLDPSFFRFIKDNPCHTHSSSEGEIVNVIFVCSGWFTTTGITYIETWSWRTSYSASSLICTDKTRHAFPSHQRNGYNRAEEIFHKFINCIHTHYLDQKDVSFYANELCISPRYLSTIARQVTGESAKTIIDRHIILETKVLLRTTEMTVQEITNHLNFPSQSYLGRYFKKHTGESPIEYRMKRKWCYLPRPALQ